MELHQLKSFVAVAEEGHLTRAAERLFISQPAVSAHVKGLEEELGVRLFDRTPRGMVLTVAGTALKSQAQAVLEQTEQLRYQAQAFKDSVSGKFRLALNTDAAFLKIPELFRLIHERHPGLEMELVQSSSARIADDLLAGNVDGGFMFRYVGRDNEPGLDMLPLRDLPVFVAAPASWAEKIRNASWEDLAELPWIWTPMDCPCCQAVVEIFAEKGLTPKTAAITDSDDTRRELVVAGSGLGLMHENEALALSGAGKVVLWDGDTMTVRACYGSIARRGADPMIGAVRRAVAEAWAVSA